MNYEDVQARLLSSYRAWKNSIHFNNEDANSLGPPLLLHVTEEYCRAEKRILVIGQETNYWGFNEDGQRYFLRYPLGWHEDSIWSMQDFLTCDSGADALCLGYQAFNFGALLSGSRPFLRDSHLGYFAQPTCCHGANWPCQRRCLRCL
jgi:hypothetical protein